MTRRDRMTVLRVAVFSLSIALLSFALGVGTEVGQRIEAAVLSASQFSYTPPAPISLVSIPSVALTLLVITAVALWRHGVSRALALVFASGGALIASQLLKQRWLTRPGFSGIDDPNTFPSGHMTVVTVIVAAVLWISPARWRGALAIAGTTVMSVSAAELIAYGWHRPSDIVGGLALGVVAFAIAAATQGPLVTAASFSGRLIVTIAVVACLTATGFAAYGALAGRQSAFLAAGCSFVVSAACVAARLLLSTSPENNRSRE